MNVRDILAALRAGWWLPTLGLLVGGGAALAVTFLSTPLYTANAQLFVSTTNAASSQEVFQGGQFSQQRVTSYAQLLTGEELAARVVERLELETSPRELSQQIDANASPETVLLDVSVTDASPERAQQIAATLGSEFTELVAELETPAAGGPSPVKVTMFDEPEIPQEPSSPQPVRNAALGLVAGLFVGAAAAIARARMDRSVKDPDEAAELAGAPVIGTVLRDAVLERAHVVQGDRSGRTAEDFRQLRANLQFINVDDPPKVIMISSALPSEGKSTTVVNLGLALNDAGKKTVLVEADLRRPKITRYLGMVSGVGLTNVLTGAADLDEVIQQIGDGLSVLGAGPAAPNPGELLSSSHMSALLDKLRSEYDYVLVDAPPLLPVADSTGLAVLMDGVLLSVRYGETRKDQLQQAAATLERVGARVLGVILNIVPPKAEVAGTYGYGYGYGYGEQPGAEGTDPESRKPRRGRRRAGR